MCGGNESGCVKDVRQSGETVVVELAGDIDLHHAPAMHKALLSACEGQPARMVIDLEKVRYMDSSGLGTLVEVFRRVKAYGGKLVLCALSDRVRSVLEITRLDKFFIVLPSQAEAMTA